jgi:PTS system fructose-specific IIA component
MTITTADLVELELPAGIDSTQATTILAERLAASGRVTDQAGFLADVRAREEQMATGLEGGIGIPHARSAHVAQASVAFGRSAEGVDFGADDGPATLIFLIAAPDGAGADHMKILGALARKLIHAEFKDGLRQAPDAASAAAVINDAVSV